MPRDVRVGPGEAQAIVRILCPRGPNLLARDHVLIPVPDNSSLHSGQIGTGPWFREKLSPNLFSADHRGYVNYLLLLGAEVQQGRGTNPCCSQMPNWWQRVVDSLLRERRLMRSREAAATVRG